MLNREWQPEWHYIDEGDYPPFYRDVLVQLNNNDTNIIAYWRDDAQWWDNPITGWVPHEGADGNPWSAGRWSFLPMSLYAPNNKCDAYIEGKDGGRCFGTKEIDPCSCEGIPRYCDFYEYMRKR